MPRVLVADDNPLSLQFFREALAAFGIDCTSAIDGAAALESARRDAFDLLLLDARMPGLDGPEVLRRIRTLQGPSRGATALATTADNDAATHVTLRAAGFVDVLVKPLAVNKLRAALDRHLPVDRGLYATDPAEWFDEGHALAAAGGDRTIAAALRRLFIEELDMLPAELAVIGKRCDAQALRDRLHRLDASAGFCGAPVLVQAGSELRAVLDAPAWPEQAIDRFLKICAHARATLAHVASTDVDGSRTP
jgi:CheY-like chemotaxis protein/HPt (histidine-containing phosphotransfer) domain-containing protein